MEEAAKAFAPMIKQMMSTIGAMGKAFYDENEIVREIFERAEKALPDVSMKDLCFESDDEELKKTENTQPALYTLAYAVFMVLMQDGHIGEVFAGHSLGEYTAVAAAGYISFEDGLRIVRKRGELMRDCVPERRGGMAAIIGLDEKAIGEICGQVGEVYQAKDQKLGRDVAIKVLPEEFAKDADRVARFQREAKLLASLNHPNIAAIYGLEESEGVHFLVMELIEGDTLADQIKKGPVQVEEALKLTPHGFKEYAAYPIFSHLYCQGFLFLSSLHPLQSSPAEDESGAITSGILAY